MFMSKFRRGVKFQPEHYSFTSTALYTEALVKWGRNL